MAAFGRNVKEGFWCGEGDFDPNLPAHINEVVGPVGYDTPHIVVSIDVGKDGF
jgi:hypothetical protein